MEITIIWTTPQIKNSANLTSLFEELRVNLYPSGSVDLENAAYNKNASTLAALSLFVQKEQPCAKKPGGNVEEVEKSTERNHPCTERSTD